MIAAPTVSKSPRTPTPIAVVTGGSSGIGRAFVAALLDRGYEVWACGRDSARLEALKAAHPQAQTVVCDVTHRASVTAFATQVGQRHGHIDLLVSNAGGSRELDLTRLDDCPDLTREIRVNYEGAVNAIAEFLPLLRATTRSHLLIVGSGYGIVPSPRVPLYAASKAAVHSLAITLRRSLRPVGVIVTEVCPPVVDTPSVRHRTVGKMAPEAVVAQALDGARRGVAGVYPGKAKFLPILARLSPALAERIVARS